MKFFLDSAKVDEIEYALDAFDIDGVTTNPRHVQVSGKPFMSAIKEIAKLVEGTDKTVSVEVNPHFMTYEEMLPEAEKLAAISPNFVIKIQCVEPAFKVISELARKGCMKDVRVGRRNLCQRGIVLSAVAEAGTMHSLSILRTQPNTTFGFARRLDLARPRTCAALISVWLKTNT